jgi:hypothetical protein
MSQSGLAVQAARETSPYTPWSCEEIGFGNTGRVSPLVKGDSRGFVQRDLRPPPSPSLSRMGAEVELFHTFPSQGESFIFILRGAVQWMALLNLPALQKKHVRGALRRDLLLSCFTYLD